MIIETIQEGNLKKYIIKDGDMILAAICTKHQIFKPKNYHYIFKASTIKVRHEIPTHPISTEAYTLFWKDLNTKTENWHNIGENIISFHMNRKTNVEYYKTLESTYIIYKL